MAIALGGSSEDMQFVDRNPMFELYDSDYVLDPRIIAANDRFVGINGAVSVDLTGQIAAESVGPSIISGPGGQLSFAIGAQLSKGRAIYHYAAVDSPRGKISRIVPMLERRLHGHGTEDYYLISWSLSTALPGFAGKHTAKGHWN